MNETTIAYIIIAALVGAILSRIINDKKLEELQDDAAKSNDAVRDTLDGLKTEVTKLVEKHTHNDLELERQRAHICELFDEMAAVKTRVSVLEK